MKRVVNIAKNFKEAEEWDIKQQVNMTHQERMEAACILRDRFYGNKTISFSKWKKSINHISLLKLELFHFHKQQFLPLQKLGHFQSLFLILFL